MPGLVPGIHLLIKKMDCRDKPGNDEVFNFKMRYDQKIGGPQAADSKPLKIKISAQARFVIL